MNRLLHPRLSPRLLFSCLALSGFLLVAATGLAVRTAHAEDAGYSQSVSQEPAPVREAVIKTAASPATRGTSPAAPASSVAVPASASPVSGSEPRILRGNDRVLAPAPRTATITGPATALRFEEAPVAEVVHVVFDEIVKADYVIHPPVAGTITLSTRSPIPPDQILLLLEATLQANGIVLARDSRGVYHIGKPDVLRGIVSPPRRVGSGPLPPGTGTVIIPLEFVGAAEMAEILRPVAAGEAIVRVDTLRNVLILAGTRTQIEGWLDLIATFDVDLLKGMSVGVFPLKYARVAEVEAALRMMTSSSGGAAATPVIPGRPGVGIPQQGQGAQPALLPESNPLYGAVRILPIERLNSILVVTPRAAYLDQARTWIERLDRPSDSDDDIQLYVYPVQNGSARHLATVLNGIFGSDSGKSGTGATGIAPGLSTGSASTSAFGRQGSGTGSVSGFGSGGFGSSGNYGGGAGAFGGGLGGGGMLGGGGLGGNTGRGGTEGAPGVSTVAAGPGVRIVADEINNAILIYGSKKEYNRIEASLRKLDIAPVQVLIEASIIEVSLTDDLKYGLQWYFSNNLGNGNGWTGAGILSKIGGGVLGAREAGFSYSILNPAGNIRAVLNALAEKSLLKVISSPSLMVLDNHPASIIVGNQQPVQTGSTTTDTGTTSTSIQYKDTGVALNVAPSVNAGNIVTMEILQSVTDVGADLDEATGQRAFLQRQISSKVAVRSGETLVLGGLIRDNNSNKRAGMPVLHDLPVLGHLFGATTIERDRTELVVVITPRVVRSDQDVRDVSDELRERMKGLVTLGDAFWPARRARASGAPDSMVSEDSAVPGNTADLPDAVAPAGPLSFPDRNGANDSQ